MAMTQNDALDRLRRRWREQHDRLGIPRADRERYVEPAGLAARLADISSRIVILPADPIANHIEFDEDLWEWWTEDHEAPFGFSPMWHKDVPTVDAAARVRTNGEQWTTYMGIHRHGGVEVGTNDCYGQPDRRCFRLIRTVALLWLGLDSQARALEHWNIAGPWQINIVLHDTQGAFLGDFGHGWREPFDAMYSQTPCDEPNVVISDEADSWPSAPDALQKWAFRLGGRIEDAWGVRHRRFLDHMGERTGEFVMRNRWDL